MLDFPPPVSSLDRVPIEVEVVLAIVRPGSCRPSRASKSHRTPPTGIEAIARIRPAERTLAPKPTLRRASARAVVSGPMAPIRIASALALMNALSAGCGSNTVPAASRSSGPGADDVACAQARDVRARVPALVDAGRLHSAAKLLEAANAACAREAMSSAAHEVSVLSELGDWKRLREVGERIEAATEPPADVLTALSAARERMRRLDVALPDTPEAKAPMRALYVQAAEAQRDGDQAKAHDLFMRAWEAWHPNGQALLQAGLLAAKLQEPAAAQRLYDRGIFELEQVTGAPVAVEVPRGLEGISSLGWSRLGRVIATSASGLSILSQSSLRDVLAVDVGDAPIDCADKACPLALSPSGQLMALGQAGAVRLWDVATGAPAGTIVDVGVVQSLAWSPDGALLAVGAFDRDVALHASSSLALVRTLAGHAADTTGVAFDSTGAMVVASFGSGEVRSFRVVDGIAGPTWKGESRLGPLACSPTGGIVAVGDREGRVHILTAGLRETQVLELGDAFNGVQALAFAPDGRTLAASADDSTFRLWATGTWTQRTVKVKSWVGALAFSSDSENIAFALGNGAVGVAATSDGSVLQRRTEMGAEIGHVAFTPREGRLAVVARDMRLRVFDLTRGTSLLVDPTAPRDEVTAMVQRRLRKRLEDAGVDLEDLLSLTIGGLAFAPDGALVTSWSKPQVWESTTGAFRSELEGDGGDVLAVSSRGVVVSGSSMRPLTVSSVSGAEESPFDGLTARRVSFSPDGAHLVALSERSGGVHDARAELWSAETRKVEWTLPLGSSYLFDARFAPDGKELALATTTLTIVDVATGSVTRTLAEASRAIAYSPDGAQLASGTLAPRGGPTLRILDAKTGSIAVEHPSLEPIVAVAYAPDGRLLATGSDHGTIALYRPPSYTPIATLRPVSGKDAAYVFDPGGAIELIGGDAAEARAGTLCRIGPYTFDFAVCSERFEVPGLLVSLVAPR